jgi:hypothetical protein
MWNDVTWVHRRGYGQCDVPTSRLGRTKIGKVPLVRRPSLRTATYALVLLVVGAALVPGLARPAAAAPPATPRPVTVLVGVGGLRWSDLDPNRTPTLWRMVGESATGSVSVRTAAPRTCPLDAWLTVSAGRRAAAVDDGDRSRGCAAVPPVARGSSVTDWPDLVRAQQRTRAVDDHPGLLGDRLAGRVDCATAVGPGAALALATSTGRVARYSATVHAAHLDRCPVGVVDGGDLLSPTGPSLARFDRLVREIAGRLPTGSRILVAGIADYLDSPPGLQVVLRWEKGSTTPYWLTSTSTRRTGIVQLTDLTAAVLESARLGPDGTDGKPIRIDALRRSGTAGTVDNREDLATLGSVVPSIVPWFGGALVGGQLFAYAVGALARRRAGRSERARRVDKVVGAAALTAACAPAATYLASPTDWWTYPIPGLALACCGLVLAVALAAFCGLVAGRRPWGLPAAVAGVTWAVLTADGISGTPLQYGSLLVSGPAVSGRFYGFNNATFAVYATSTLLLAGAVAAMLRARGRRGYAALAVAGIGAVAVAVDGWPAFGADFGGVLALVPGVALLALAAAGRRVTAARLGVAAATAVVAVTGIAVADWLRPEDSRTHLGDFVARVLAGDAGDIVARKAEASLATLLFPVAGPFAVVAFAVAIAAVWRPSRLRLTGLARAFDRTDLLRPALASVVVTAVLGFLVNDTGVVVPGMALLLAVPLLVATCVRRVPAPTPPPVIMRTAGPVPLPAATPPRAVPRGGRRLDGPS